jgi:hypothetical protein
MLTHSKILLLNSVLAYANRGRVASQEDNLGNTIGFENLENS